MLCVSVVRMMTGVTGLLVLSLALGRYRVQYTSVDTQHKMT